MMKQAHKAGPVKKLYMLSWFSPANQGIYFFDHKDGNNHGAIMNIMIDTPWLAAGPFIFAAESRSHG